MNFNSFQSCISGSKRQKLDVDHDTGSDNVHAHSPIHKLKRFASPSPAERMSSPESELDVDSAPDDSAPENLSLKKENSKSPSLSPASASTPNPLGFLPYTQQSPVSYLHGVVNTSPSHRSPVDLLAK